jgi:hypothetical protein
MAGRLKAEQRQRDAEAAQAAKSNERGVPVAREGTIVAGSWRAADASVEVIFCDTYAAQASDPAIAPINHPRVPVWSTQYQDLYGPVGGERVHLVPTQSGYAAIIQHNEDDAIPDLPAGERWVQHRNANGDVDAYWRHTNDGPTEGDGLGGAQYGGQGALSTFTTKSGHKVTLNDTTQQVTVETSGGHVTTMDDSAGTITTTTSSGHSIELNDPAQTITVQTQSGLSDVFSDVAGTITRTVPNATLIVQQGEEGVAAAINAIAPSVGFGAAFHDLEPTAAAIVNNDLNTMLNDSSTGINVQRLVDIKNVITAMITAMAASGVPSLPTAAACIGELATLANIPTPAGSAIVRLLSTAP